MIMSDQITSFQIIHNDAKRHNRNEIELNFGVLIFYSTRIQITAISQRRLFDTSELVIKYVT